MDITGSHFEKMCSKMKRNLSNYFDWDNIDISYSMIDVEKELLYTAMSNYKWQISYWGYDLDLRFSERMYPGFKNWQDYSETYQYVLLDLKKISRKIDLCSKYNNVYEIFTIGTTSNVSEDDIQKLYKWRSVVANYAHRTWKKHPHAAQVLSGISSHRKDDDVYAMRNLETPEIMDYIRFGNIYFSNKELLTIRLLLSHRTLDEISQIQGCHRDIEKQRIDRIADKLNCKNAHKNKLLDVMSSHGITLIYLESVIN